MISHRLIRSSLLLWAALHLGLAGALAQVHGLYREVFTNSTAMKLEQSVNFPTRPLFKSIMTEEFETPLDIPYLAGQRVRGLLVPRSSGPYRFFVSCEGPARLYLGTNETSESRALIASVPECLTYAIIAAPPIRPRPGSTLPPAFATISRRFRISAVGRPR